MGERGALCILLMICIIGGAFLLGGLLFSRSVSTILQLVVACAYSDFQCIYSFYFVLYYFLEFIYKVLSTVVLCK